ncbi:MAG: hypothetical protein WAV76_03080 [Bacteroidota bacterium]
MAKKSKKRLAPRELMELAIAKMKLSRSEPRSDGKASPKVGAVLISPNGEVIDFSYRGELMKKNEKDCYI